MSTLLGREHAGATQPGDHSECGLPEDDEGLTLLRELALRAVEIHQTMLLGGEHPPAIELFRRSVIAMHLDRGQQLKLWAVLECAGRAAQRVAGE